MLTFWPHGPKLTGFFLAYFIASCPFTFCYVPVDTPTQFGPDIGSIEKYWPDCDRQTDLLTKSPFLWLCSPIGWEVNSTYSITGHITYTVYCVFSPECCCSSDTLLNVFLAIAVDNLANAQELTKVGWVTP